MSEDLSRGVQNPKVVDLVAEDPESGEVVLTILEQRAWGADPQQLHQLQDKLNSYLGYALDGYLARDYPDYGGRPVRFELVCSEAPGPDQRGFLVAFRNYADTQGIGFAVVTRSADP